MTSFEYQKGWRRREKERGMHTSSHRCSYN